jgi:hypothetical protein
VKRLTALGLVAAGTLAVLSLRRPGPPHAAVAPVSSATEAELEIAPVSSAMEGKLAFSPSGDDANWQYGYSAVPPPSLSPEHFRRGRPGRAEDPIRFWHAGPELGGYYPYVAQNTTNKVQVDRTQSWALSPGQLALEASSQGHYALVRLVVPRPGRYRIDARFAGVHFRLSTTDVYVVTNATTVFESEILGYGGDPGSHAIEGERPSAEYHGTHELAAGDLITFAVGYGRNQTHNNDTTGLTVRLRIE